jgi:hypothetical protein
MFLPKSKNSVIFKKIGQTKTWKLWNKIIYKVNFIFKANLNYNLDLKENNFMFESSFKFSIISIILYITKRIFGDF